MNLNQIHALRVGVEAGLDPDQIPDPNPADPIPVPDPHLAVLIAVPDPHLEISPLEPGPDQQRGGDNSYIAADGMDNSFIL